MRIKAIVLKNHGHAPGFWRKLSDIAVIQNDVAELGLSRPAIMRRVVVFPQPEGPEKHRESTIINIQIEMIDHDTFEKLLQVAAVEWSFVSARYHVLTTPKVSPRTR